LPIKLKRMLTSTIMLTMLSATTLNISFAADYPHDSVTLVTHSKSGGGTDFFLRELVKHLGPYLGAEFIVENVRGGSGAKAMERLTSVSLILLMCQLHKSKA